MNHFEFYLKYISCIHAYNDKDVVFDDQLEKLGAGNAFMKIKEVTTI